MVEYGLIIAGIALAVMAVIWRSDKIAAMFDSVSGDLVTESRKRRLQLNNHRMGSFQARGRQSRSIIRDKLHAYAWRSAYEIHRLIQEKGETVRLWSSR